MYLSRHKISGILILFILILSFSCSAKKDTDSEKKPFTLVYKTSQNELSKQKAEILQQQLKEVGIDLKIQSLEWATFYSDILSGNFSIYSLEWVGIKDPDFYFDVFNSKSIPPNGLNRGRYKNPEMDRLTELGRKTTDQEKRKEYYSEIQKIAAEDLPYIPLWHRTNIAAMRTYVEGFELYPSGDYYSFTKTSCEGKNELVIGIESEPTVLDPRFGTDAASSRILQLICPGLLKTDLKGNLLPDIAESYKIENDNVYIFKIRKDVYFHHNRQLTSKDVKFTLESILNPSTKSPKKGGFNLIERIETPDDFTVKIYLKEVNAAFIQNMQIGIVPEDQIRKLKDDFQSRPVGAGPFQFEKWERGQYLILSRSKNYYENEPVLEKIRFKLIKENTIRLLELEKGTIDFLQNDIPPDFLKRLYSNQEIKVIKAPSTNFSYIGFNLENPILSNKDFRKALALAINRDMIIEHILKDEAEKATGILSHLSWAYDDNVKKYDFKPDLSKEILNKIFESIKNSSNK